MTVEDPSPEDLRKELLAKSTVQLPRGVFTAMPKIPSPFGDGPPSQAWFREDVMIGAQWLKDNPLKHPFFLGQRPAVEEDTIELENLFATISPGHNPRTLNQLMYHLGNIAKDGVSRYVNFLSAEREVG